jgi:hypothetical protein
VQEHFAVEVLDPGFEVVWAEAAAEGETAVGAEVDGDPEHLLGVALGRHGDGVAVGADRVTHVHGRHAEPGALDGGSRVLFAAERI